MKNIITKLKIYNAKKDMRNYILNSRKDYSEKKFNIDKYLKYEELNYNIELFNRLFEDSLTKERKELFNKNIKKLKINKIPGECKLNNKNTGACYIPQSNEINIYGDLENDDEINHKLMHELLHLSSSKANGYMDGLTISTVHENGLYSTTGSGINEGYTELLNSRYFSRKENVTNYNQEIVIAAGIEKIIGKEKMLDCYFKYTLLDLITELKKYYGDNKYYLNLISKVDVLSNTKDINQKNLLYKNIKKEIINIYRCKLVNQLNNKEIDFKEFSKQKFFGIDLYNMYDFIYMDNAEIKDMRNRYLVTNESGFIYLNKDDDYAKEYIKNR